MPTLPVWPDWLPVPQLRVIMMFWTEFGATVKGGLVPVQLSPLLAVADSLTVSPASPVGVTGTTMSSETVALGSDTLNVPGPAIVPPPELLIWYVTVVIVAPLGSTTASLTSPPLFGLLLFEQLR